MCRLALTLAWLLTIAVQPCVTRPASATGRREPAAELRGCRGQMEHEVKQVRM